MTTTATINTVPATAAREISRRRTFAIISHPDAGKTTLTEKLLLYGGAIGLAGSVTSKKEEQSTSSDWMAMEKERGISVSSTVLQFEYKDRCVNLLDTPGHHDFSEDTYRVLSAVDAAVMVIDAGKGVEPQTLKLFDVCRQRGVPIFVFVNKMDRPSRAPLELIDELEEVLKLAPAPVNWPLGDGPRFRGVYDRSKDEVHLFERTTGGAFKAPLEVAGIEDDKVREALSDDLYEAVTSEVEMLDGLTEPLDIERVLAGEQMPIYFGSAMNNFGVENMLESFLEMAPEPAGRVSDEKMVAPETNNFSGFVFKIQANMNPRHRDRAVFVRIVSGIFERDMQVIDQRTGKKVRLSNAQKLFGQDRETLDTAYAGDILALVGNYNFLIGDTLTSDPKVVYNEMPRFTPECFTYIVNNDTANIKRYRAGMEQLMKEGVAQAYNVHGSMRAVPLLGAVGPLQFEVLQARLISEYQVETRLEHSPWSVVQWFEENVPDTMRRDSDPPEVKLPSGCSVARDQDGNWVVLLSSQYMVSVLHDRNDHLTFRNHANG
ncbi:peptide chain release factor 3 [Persicirhabdus sediminis]|uniref:Peptide chain release factor 3 n=1 Tax=Persicirhabdus sediminis TaxID=454144 RepID=A0A8J7SJL6_9BACT|nr:peptide chain release factor 3 [Persicirhabdus sediminis]MBK1790225.1 peptide chain release factor 3 [Persicirhabdus sediminis]